jgi:hypothetical protein
VTAWHGDPELKERIVARMRQHRKDDAFIQGAYQELDISLPLGYRGCAIGCLLDKDPDVIDSWHGLVASQFGIPYGVAEIIDSTFESFCAGDDSHARASDFAVAAIEAIPVGADLTDVFDQFHEWHATNGFTDDNTEGAWVAEENRYAAKLIELVAAAPTREAVSDAG